MYETFSLRKDTIITGMRKKIKTSIKKLYNMS